MIKLCIHSPAKPAWLCDGYRVSLQRTLDLLEGQLIACDAPPAIRDCPWIGHARAAINAMFMASDCTHLLMIDSDIDWRPEDVVRMLEHDVQLVAAVAADRKTGKFLLGGWNGEAVGEGRFQYDKATALIKAGRVSSAFILIHRGAIDAMMLAHPDLYAHRSAEWFLKDATPSTVSYFYAFWEQRVDGGNWPGEDHAFCDRAAEAGVQLYVDPHVVLGHNVGVRLSGCLADTMKVAGALEAAA